MEQYSKKYPITFLSDVASLLKDEYTNNNRSSSHYCSNTITGNHPLRYGFKEWRINTNYRLRSQWKRQNNGWRMY